MRILEERVGTPLCFSYDPRTEETLIIMKSVDLTDESSLGMPVVLDFVQATEGMMVQVSDGTEEVCDPCYISMLDRLDLDDESNFVSAAQRFGFAPEQLLLIVKREAPPIDHEKQRADFRKYAEEPDHMFDFCLQRAGLTTADLMR